MLYHHDTAWYVCLGWPGVDLPRNGVDNLTVNYPGRKEVSEGHEPGQGCKPFSFWALWVFVGLLTNLYTGQEATVRTGHEQQTGSKLGKEYIKAVYCHPAYLTYMQSTS